MNILPILFSLAHARKLTITSAQAIWLAEIYLRNAPLIGDAVEAVQALLTPATLAHIPPLPEHPIPTHDTEFQRLTALNQELIAVSSYPHAFGSVVVVKPHYRVSDHLWKGTLSVESGRFHYANLSYWHLSLIQRRPCGLCRNLVNGRVCSNAALAEAILDSGHKEWLCASCAEQTAATRHAERLLVEQFLRLLHRP